MNNRILRVLNKQQTDRTPIWIMRQAGRYLPEYQALRKQAGSFKKLYQLPELASQATLLPINRFDLDAAIIFSDILIVLEALGLEVNFDSQGPQLAKPIRKEQDLLQLRTEESEAKFGYLSQAISLVKKELKVPLIGFVGSPWTLAVYAVEGQGSKAFLHIRKMLYQSPQLLHRLLARLTAEITALALLQLKQGADIIQIFDSWASLLSPHHYEAFSLSYSQKIIKSIRTATQKPVILYAKGCPLPPASLASCGANALGLDWQINLHQAFDQLKDSIVLQGNLDPAALYGDKESLSQEVNRIFAARPPGCHHIFNLGHGIYPDTPPANVAHLIELVHSLSRT